MRGALRGAALEGIQAAYANGAVILLEGFSAIGVRLVADRRDEVEAGLEWLIGAAVLTGVERRGALRQADLLRRSRRAIAVAIMPGSALALGPDGQIETWGEREVTIALGPAYGT